MFATILLTFFAGVFAANATPHFVRGITKDRFPTPFGSGSVPNIIGGWLMYVIAALLLIAADVNGHPVASFVSIALGVLLMGLFHASIGAFGKKD